ncbi:MAG: hypothetical protein Q7R84_03200 [bacterium]|nr:hypothetical protein [bacterium]
MARERYSKMDRVTAFGFLANALENRRGGDGDTGSSFPRTDAEDMSKGARFIPGEVTLARRAGEKASFVTKCGPNCWYWKMPDGSRIYHFDPITYHSIGTANGRKEVKGDDYRTHFEDGAGPCPHCGNPNTNGGMIKP